MIVLSYNNSDATVELVRHIVAGWGSQEHHLKLHILDNGSSPSSRVALANINGTERDDLSITIDRVPDNLGFAAGVNWVVRANSQDPADAIILSNDDIGIDLVELESMMTSFASRSDLWVLAPAIQHARHVNPLVGGRITRLYRVRYHSSFGTPGIHRVGFVPFTFAILREVPSLGEKLLSEAVFFGEEDVTYALRSQALGRSIAVDDRIIVRHDASQTRRRNSAADELDERLLGAASRSVTVRLHAGPTRWQVWRIATLTLILLRTIRRFGPRRLASFGSAYWRETRRKSLGREDFYRLAKMHA